MGNGYAGMSDRDLKMATVAAACAGGSSGGGGVTCGTGAPVAAPSGGCGLYIQTDGSPAGQLWTYYSGSWH